MEIPDPNISRPHDPLIQLQLTIRGLHHVTTHFTLYQLEYGITDRAEILIENFFYEWDKPKDGPFYSGVGDLEVTPSYMMVLDDPNSWTPAAVAAFKLKVPTATNRDIGTGEFDYQPYIIIGKTLCEWTWNANIGYNFVTSPKG